MDTFLQNRLTALETRIVAYEDAILALSSPGIYSYSLNDGQTTEQVTRQNVDKLEAVLTKLMNQRDTYRERLGLSTGGNDMVVPSW